MQNIQFSMNPKGGKIFSEALIYSPSISAPRMTARIFNFCEPCYMFIKEKDKENPYFSVKLDSNFVEIIK